MDASEPNDLYQQNEALVYQIILNDYKYINDPAIEHDLDNIEDSDLLAIGRVALWQASERFTGKPGMFSRYASAAIHNAITDQLRASTKQRPDGTEYAQDGAAVEEWPTDEDDQLVTDSHVVTDADPFDDGDDDTDDTPAAQLTARIRDYLAELPEVDDVDEIMLALKRRADGWTWWEIADEAGLVESSFKPKVLRLMRKVREVFGSDWGVT